MDINYLEIRSSITPVNSIFIGEFFREIEREGNFKLKSVTKEEWVNSDFNLVYIATGGTEGIFLDNIDLFTKNTCYILTSGESNSLAASMEILSYLQQNNKKGEILHGDSATIAKRINTIYKVNKAIKNFKGKRLGIFGKPSDWLISSVYNKDYLLEKFDITLVEVPMNEVIREIKLNLYDETKDTIRLKSMKYDIVEVDKSLYVYGGLKRLVERFNLDGFTIRCFDLLDSVNTTGCLGLAILNSEGIFSGCEGDVPALLSMIILNNISGHPVFQCNPSRINLKRNEMVLAHCTLPLNLPYEFNLTTHYESGIGVAIAGLIPIGDMTIFKTSGSLDRYYVNNGTIIRNLKESNLCRSQILIKLDDFSYFTSNPISNHHLICTGNYKEEIEEFFKNLN